MVELFKQKPDNLALMFKMQKALQEKAYGFKFDDMTLKERVDFVKEMSIHTNQEINEMLYELPYFKPWKNYDGMSDEEVGVAMTKAKEELVDVTHFFLNLAIGLGMTAEDLALGYIAKNEENYRRQEAGYTHDVKYRD